MKPVQCLHYQSSELRAQCQLLVVEVGTEYRWSSLAESGVVLDWETRNVLSVRACYMLRWGTTNYRRYQSPNPNP